MSKHTKKNAFRFRNATISFTRRLHAITPSISVLMAIVSFVRKSLGSNMCSLLRASLKVTKGSSKSKANAEECIRTKWAQTATRESWNEPVVSVTWSKSGYQLKIPIPAVQRLRFLIRTKRGKFPRSTSGALCHRIINSIPRSTVWRYLSAPRSHRSPTRWPRRYCSN